MKELNGNDMQQVSGAGGIMQGVAFGGSFVFMASRGTELVNNLTGVDIMPYVVDGVVATTIGLFCVGLFI